jgi:AI-2 transport protein TqsA
METGPRERGPRVLVTTACLVVIVAGLKVAGTVLVPLVFAAFLAALTAPIVLWMREHKIPLGISVPLVVVGVFGILGAFAGVLVKSVDSFIVGWPRYALRIDAIYEGNIRWLETQGVELDWSQVSTVVDPGALTKLVSGTLTGLAGMLTNIVLVVLILVFTLLEVVGAPRKLRLALGDPTADLSRFEKITTEVKQYLVIKTYVSLATGVLVWVLLAILGVDFAVFWGVVAFVLNFIPSVGSLIGALPAIVLSAIQYDLGVAAIVGGGYLAINMTLGNLIEPQLMGRKLGLSVLVVFLSLLFWGWLWGPAGMLLAVPLTMVIKIALENSDQWSWVSILMDPPPKPEGKLVSGSLRPGPPSVRPLDIFRSGRDAAPLSRRSTPPPPSRRSVSPSSRRSEPPPSSRGSVPSSSSRQAKRSSQPEDG